MVSLVENRRSLAGLATSFVAATLNARRVELGISYDDLAVRAELGKATTHRALSGQSDISLETLVRLCRVMGLDAGGVLVEAQQHIGALPSDEG